MPKDIVEKSSLHGNAGKTSPGLGGRCFLPQAPRSYPIPMAHRVTPGHPEVTPGTKSYWHTSTTPPLVWQTKYVKCVLAIANHIFNIPSPLVIWFRYEPWRDPTAFTRTCASRMAHRLRQTSIIFRLFEQSERSSSAWHTKFHGISHIQTWMWSMLQSCGFCGEFSFMPINPFIHFWMAHRWSDRLSFFRSSSDAFGFFRAASSPFTNLLVLCPKNRALPRSSSTSNDSSSSSSSSRPSSKPLQSLSKTSPGWVLTGCNFNEVRTRSKIKFWETDPLSLLTKSLVATRFRILFRTIVELKSFQRWSRRGNQVKQQLQARARRQKRRQRASKGNRGETKGRKLGKQGGGEKFERAQTGWDVGTVCSIVYIWAPNWSKPQLKHMSCFTYETCYQFQNSQITT